MKLQVLVGRSGCGVRVCISDELPGGTAGWGAHFLHQTVWVSVVLTLMIERPRPHRCVLARGTWED